MYCLAELSFICRIYNFAGPFYRLYVTFIILQVVFIVLHVRFIVCQSFWSIERERGGCFIVFKKQMLQAANTDILTH